MRASTVLAISMLLTVLCLAPARAQPGPAHDCADCPEMIEVAGGSFTMGAAPGEEERENVPPPFRGRSAPQVKLAIKSLAVGKYEITRAQYAAFATATGRPAADGCYVFEASRWQKQAGRDWRNPGFAQTDRDPVVCVSWDDADAYTRWLASTTGKPYRLLSEAEWEYVARAGSTAAWSWGDAKGDACLHGNFADQTAAATLNWSKDPETTFSCTDNFVYTAPVGSFSPNAFGLYDMLGNVWEWTADCWTDNLATMNANRAASGSGYAVACADRVYRGGAWYGSPWDTRTSVRVGAIAGFASIYVGFRVARGD